MATAELQEILQRRRLQNGESPVHKKSAGEEAELVGLQAGLFYPGHVDKVCQAFESELDKGKQDFVAVQRKPKAAVTFGSPSASYERSASDPWAGRGCSEESPKIRLLPPQSGFSNAAVVASSPSNSPGVSSDWRGWRFPGATDSEEGGEEALINEIVGEVLTPWADDADNVEIEVATALSSPVSAQGHRLGGFGGESPSNSLRALSKEQPELLESCGSPENRSSSGQCSLRIFTGEPEGPKLEELHAQVEGPRLTPSTQSVPRLLESREAEGMLTAAELVKSLPSLSSPAHEQGAAAPETVDPAASSQGVKEHLGSKLAKELLPTEAAQTSQQELPGISVFAEPALSAALAPKTKELLGRLQEPGSPGKLQELSPEEDATFTAGPQAPQSNTNGTTQELVGPPAAPEDPRSNPDRSSQELAEPAPEAQSNPDGSPQEPAEPAPKAPQSNPDGTNRELLGPPEAVACSSQGHRLPAATLPFSSGFLLPPGSGASSPRSNSGGLQLPSRSGAASASPVYSSRLRKRSPEHYVKSASACRLEERLRLCRDMQAHVADLFLGQSHLIRRQIRDFSSAHLEPPGYTPRSHSSSISGPLRIGISPPQAAPMVMPPSTTVTVDSPMALSAKARMRCQGPSNTLYGLHTPPGSAPHQGPRLNRGAPPPPVVSARAGDRFHPSVVPELSGRRTPPPLLASRPTSAPSRAQRRSTPQRSQAQPLRTDNQIVAQALTAELRALEAQVQQLRAQHAQMAQEAPTPPVPSQAPRRSKATGVRPIIIRGSS